MVYRQQFIKLIVVALLLSVGVGVSQAAWINFGGNDGTGQVWGYNIIGGCKDGVRVGFAANYFYRKNNDGVVKPNLPVRAALSVKDSTTQAEILKPHAVHPPKQGVPIVVDDGFGTLTTYPYWTIVDIPFKTPFDVPLTLGFDSGHDISMTASNSFNEFINEIVLGDCTLFNEVKNGGYEKALKLFPTRPYKWQAQNLGSKDTLVCDSYKVPLKDSTFVSFEAGLVGPPNVGNTTYDPKYNPGCAFKFVGTANKTSTLTQTLNITKWPQGGSVFFTSYVRGVGGAKPVKVFMTLVVTYTDNSTTVGKGAYVAQDEFAKGYTEFFNFIQLDGAKTIKSAVMKLGYKGDTGSVFFDGTRVQVNAPGALSLSDSSWLSLPATN